MENKISLRGSLAATYLRRFIKPGSSKKDLDSYLSYLLNSDDPSLLKINENDTTVIGKRSERGYYPPDW